jgi:hypothetical protein
MQNPERRDTSRYELNYPILLSEGTMDRNRAHLAQVLDAGSDGMRLLMAGVNPLRVGSELDLACSPARDAQDGRDWKPIRLRCRVAWQDLENNQIGLTYIQ